MTTLGIKKIIAILNLILGLLFNRMRTDFRDYRGVMVLTLKGLLKGHLNLTFNK